MASEGVSQCRCGALHAPKATRARGEIEEVVKAQQEGKRGSPGKYYLSNDLTWEILERKTGRNRTT